MIDHEGQPAHERVGVAPCSRSLLRHLELVAPDRVAAGGHGGDRHVDVLGAKVANDPLGDLPMSLDLIGPRVVGVVEHGLDCVPDEVEHHRTALVGTRGAERDLHEDQAGLAGLVHLLVGDRIAALGARVDAHEVAAPIDVEAELRARFHAPRLSGVEHEALAGGRDGHGATDRDHGLVAVVAHAAERLFGLGTEPRDLGGRTVAGQK